MEWHYLLEWHYNNKFKAYIDRFMPQWQLYRGELNRSPLAHED